MFVVCPDRPNNTRIYKLQMLQSIFSRRLVLDFLAVFIFVHLLRRFVEIYGFSSSDVVRPNNSFYCSSWSRAHTQQFISWIEPFENDRISNYTQNWSLIERNAIASGIFVYSVEIGQCVSGQLYNYRGGASNVRTDTFLWLCVWFDANARAG